jgi:hypothetical protein
MVSGGGCYQNKDGNEEVSNVEGAALVNSASFVWIDASEFDQKAFEQHDRFWGFVVAPIVTLGVTIVRGVHSMAEHPPRCRSSSTAETIRLRALAFRETLRGRTGFISLSRNRVTVASQARRSAHAVAGHPRRIPGPPVPNPRRNTHPRVKERSRLTERLLRGRR